MYFYMLLHFSNFKSTKILLECIEGGPLCSFEARDESGYQESLTWTSCTQWTPPVLHFTIREDTETT